MPVSKKRRKNGNAGQEAASGGGNSRTWVLTGLGAAILFGGALWYLTGGGSGVQVDVTVPPLTGAAVKGEQVFNANCARCHGKNAAGSNTGPALVQKIYEPSHHGDSAFFRAATRGVRAHHWQFGNMPPVPGIKGQDIRAVVAYVRALQAANGIR